MNPSTTQSNVKRVIFTIICLTQEGAAELLIWSGADVAMPPSMFRRIPTRQAGSPATGAHSGRPRRIAPPALVVPQLHGDCMGIAWGLHGDCMGVAWELHGSCM